MATILRVGVVGVSLERGWAQISHVPALKGLTGIEFAGVTGRNQSTADAIAREVGATRGFADAATMARDPAIDVVTVAVRVPSHRDLVLQALTAGKHVFCEWPLGRDVEEAEELRDAAEASGVHVAVGLQTRANPALRKARELVAGGAVGRVLSARLYSGTVAFGPKMDEADAYLDDPANGATHVAIHGGHALDAAIAVLGSLQDVSALGTIQFPEVSVGDGTRTYRRTIPDLLLTQSRFAGGVALATEVDGGRPAGDTRFRFVVNGEKGSLSLEGGELRGFQSGRLTLLLNGEQQSVDEGEAAGLPATAANVASLYAAFRDDIANGTRTVPDFDHAVRLTRLLTAVARSSERGARVDADAWPLG